MESFYVIGTRLRRYSNARFLFHLPTATLQVDMRWMYKLLLVNKIPSARVAGLINEREGFRSNSVMPRLVPVLVHDGANSVKSPKYRIAIPRKNLLSIFNPLKRCDIESFKVANFAI